MKKVIRTCYLLIIDAEEDDTQERIDLTWAIKKAAEAAAEEIGFKNKSIQRLDMIFDFAEDVSDEY